MAIYRPTIARGIDGLRPKHKHFDYSLRVSRRARRVRLAVKPFVGLEVVIPRRFPQHQIERILQQHADWITTQLDKHAPSFAPLRLPTQIKLRLTGQEIDITYQTASRPRVQEMPYRLMIFHQHHAEALQMLRKWVRQQARKQLTPRLHAVATEFDFDFQRNSIRSQKSRWGSCSSHGTISLNDQLMFLPADSVRYLMIHELCHTRHMNHSADFWKLVESCCADYRRHEQLLNQGRDLVPDWFLQSLYRQNSVTDSPS